MVVPQAETKLVADRPDMHPFSRGDDERSEASKMDTDSNRVCRDSMCVSCWAFEAPTQEIWFDQITGEKWQECAIHNRGLFCSEVFLLRSFVHKVIFSNAVDLDTFNNQRDSCGL